MSRSETIMAARAGREGPDGLGSEVLAAHNGYRSKHGAPPLLWSRQAAEAANRWAVRLKSIGKTSSPTRLALLRSLLLKAD